MIGRNTVGIPILQEFLFAQSNTWQARLHWMLTSQANPTKQNDKQKRLDHAPNMDFSKEGDKYAIRMLILFASDLNWKGLIISHD